MGVNGRALLPMLWLLASEDEDPTSGLIKDDLKKIAFRLRITEKDVKNGINEIIKAGFICSSETVADSGCNETVTKPYRFVTPETETETETETDITAKSFNNFWEVYPRKIDKKKAMKSYKTAIKKTEVSTINLAAEKYAKECVKNKTEKNYIKHPTSWLNGECWENYQGAIQKVTMVEALEGVHAVKHNQLKLNYRRNENEEAFRKLTGYGYEDIR